VRPDVVVQVAGGGSGVGIAGLIDGTLDVAAASREMKAAERRGAAMRNGAEPVELTVARDALAVYVHRTNPIRSLSLPELGEIYGEDGSIGTWSQLGVRHAGCASDRIIRIGRQNNSGTFAYFRDAVLGRAREYKMGSIDQSGSKDVVALVARTPCAIGYSGIAYATDGVKPVPVAREHSAPAVFPDEAAVTRGSYPLARPLYLYAARAPEGHIAAFLAWVLGPEGQRIVRDLGLVPAPEGSGRAAVPEG
jgi:phosphate transport system substrate-binding protein